MVSLSKLKNSFSYAFEGFKFAYLNDQNLRIHLFVALLVILFAFILRIPRIEFLILLLVILMVLWAEMINTVVEKTVDLITTEHHKSAKIAKDVSSAMVLLTAIGAVVIGFFIFYPHLTNLF